MSEEDVPTQRQIWEFLVGLKDTTVQSFRRVETQLAVVHSDQQKLKLELKADIAGVGQRLTLRIDDVEHKLSWRIAAVDDRLSEFQTTVMRRLDDHEDRITRLEDR